MSSEPARDRTPPRAAILVREYGRARASAPEVNARYNRAMSTLKLVLPGVAAVLIAVVAAWPLFSPRTTGLPINMANVTQDELDSLKMINPRYVGVDGRNQPFSITATSATQIDAKGGVVALDEPKADITLQNGTWVALTAVSGTFSQKDQIIQLSEAVHLFHDAGYEFRTNAAFIDLASGTAHGADAVEGQGPLGALASQGFRVLDKGHRVIFTGKAKLVIVPKKAPFARKTGPK